MVKQNPTHRSVVPLAMFNAVNELVTCSSMSFVKVTDEAVLGQLAQLCQRYGIDAEKISCEYFSFANNTKATIKGKLIRGTHDFVESVHCSSFTMLFQVRPPSKHWPHSRMRS